MFLDLVPLWLDITKSDLLKKIDKAIALNQKLEPEVKHSSSAADTYDIIYVLFIDWKLLDLPVTDKYEKILQQILKVNHTSSFPLLLL